MFNRNTQNTFVDAAARSSCFQSEQVLQHDWQIKSLSPSPHKDSCWVNLMYSFLLVCYVNYSWKLEALTCFSRVLVWQYCCFINMNPPPKKKKSQAGDSDANPPWGNFCSLKWTVLPPASVVLSIRKRKHTLVSVRMTAPRIHINIEFS